MSTTCWFFAPHPMRQAGLTAGSEAGVATSVILPERYDAVIFVCAPRWESFPAAKRKHK